jgi:capsular polysaccharide biosynthesis protein
VAANGHGEEQEVDLARYGWGILARWWLVALAIALGLLAGYLISLGGGRLFEATATVYLGAPLTPSSGAPVQSLQTNPATVNQIVRSTAVVRDVAERVGVDAEQLRLAVSTKAVASGTGARTTQTQLVEVSVRGPWRRQSAEAANLLAAAAIDRISEYPRQKIALLEEEAVSRNAQLEAIEERLERYRAAVETASDLTSAEQLVLLTLVDDAQQERDQLAEERREIELALTLARELEASQLVTEAAARKVSARGRGSSLIVGAVIGLLLGIVAAIAWEPVLRRVRRRSAGNEAEQHG